MDVILYVVAWLIVGAAAGYVGNTILRTHVHQNLRLEMGVAIFGAVVAGGIFALLDVPRVENFTLWSVISALAGASVLLFLLRMYTSYFDPTSTE